MDLSIIVPVYNVEAYLSKCLDSLILNDIEAGDYEIILLNYGSTDSSKSIAENYAGSHTNIRLINQENQGLGGARNTGIQHAKGAYLMFVDSDDYIQKNSLKSLLERAKSQDLDVLRFNHEEVDENGQIIPKKKNATHAVVFEEDIIDGKKYLSERMGYACYVCLYLFKSKFINSGRYLFKEQIYFEDVEWLPRVLLDAGRVSSMNLHVYNYLKRSESITKSLQKEKAEKRFSDQGLIVNYLNNLQEGEHNSGVIKWAKGLIALTIMSRLSMVANHLKHKRKEAIRDLKESKILPLQSYNFTRKQGIYAVIINICPRIFIMIKRNQ